MLGKNRFSINENKSKNLFAAYVYAFRTLKDARTVSRLAEQPG